MQGFEQINLCHNLMQVQNLVTLLTLQIYIQFLYNKNAGDMFFFGFFVSRTPIKQMHGIS